jgi:hypothetical protein
MGRILELGGGAAPDVREDDQRLRGVGRIDREGSIVVPQLEAA